MIQRSHLYQCGIFTQVHGNYFTSITLNIIMDLCGRSGSMPTLNTVVWNKYRTQTDLTLCGNFEKYSPFWATLSKSFRTMVHHSHPANSANSATNMESVISSLPSIILQQMGRLNVSSKCSNVQFVRTPLLPRTVHILPQPSNLIQSPKYIVVI